MIKRNFNYKYVFYQNFNEKGKKKQNQMGCFQTLSLVCVIILLAPFIYTIDCGINGYESEADPGTCICYPIYKGVTCDEFDDIYLIGETPCHFTSLTFDRHVVINKTVLSCVFDDCVFMKGLSIYPREYPVCNCTLYSIPSGSITYNTIEIINSKFYENGVTANLEGLGTTLELDNNVFNIPDNGNKYLEDAISIKSLKYQTQFLTVLISNNIFNVGTDCLASNTYCLNSFIFIQYVDTDTFQRIVFYENAVNFTTNIESLDTPVKHGILVDGPSLLQYEIVLSNWVLYELSYDAYGRTSRNIKEYNPEMYGHQYDVAFLVNEFSADVIVNTTCSHEKRNGACLLANTSQPPNYYYDDAASCKHVCGIACMVDPTRYDPIEENVCLGKTIFHEINDALSDCPWNLVYLIRVTYTLTEQIVFSKYLPITTQTLRILFDANTIGNYGSGYTITTLPTLYFSEPDGIDPILLNGGEITFRNIKFKREQGITFDNKLIHLEEGVTTVNTMDFDDFVRIRFWGCEFEGNGNGVIFDQSCTDTNDPNNRIIVFQSCVFNNYPINPWCYSRLNIRGCDFYDMDNGIVNAIKQRKINLRNNYGENISPNEDCDALVCLTGIKNNEKALTILIHNDINGVPVAYDFYTGYQYSAYKLKYLRFLYSAESRAYQIVGNDDTNVFYGIEYDFLDVPCNYDELYTMKTENPDVFGDTKDIICRRGALPVIEYSCSGDCIPPRDPPSFCIVDPAYPANGTDFEHIYFHNVSTAVDMCRAAPNMTIYLTYGYNYNEFGGDKLLEIKKNQPDPHFDDQEGFFMAPLGYSFFDPPIELHRIAFEVTEVLHVTFYGIKFIMNNSDGLTFDTVIKGEVHSFIMLFSSIISVLDSNVYSILDEPTVDYGIDISISEDGNPGVSLWGLDVVIAYFTVYGVKRTAIKINEVDNYKISIGIDSVVGRMVYGSLLDFSGIHKFNAKDITCDVYCGLIQDNGELSSFLIRVVNENAFDSFYPFEFEIDGINIGVNDLGVQNLVSTSYTGTGYIASIWIQGPSTTNTDFVDEFMIRNLITNGYPVGLRYINISPQILEYVEDGNPPLQDDFKRGMRETARYNTIEGSIYDLKLGYPGQDIPGHPGNTCNDLCPSIQDACEVDQDFSTSVDLYGTYRFRTVGAAIEDCAIVEEPVPIKLIDSTFDGYYINDKVHTENIVFDNTRDIYLTGDYGIADNSKIVIEGKHRFISGNDNKITIVNLDFKPGPSKNNPIFRTNSGVQTSYSIDFINIMASTDYVSTDASTEIPHPFIRMGITNGVKILLQDVIIDKGFFPATKAVVEIKGAGDEVRLNNVLFEFSNWGALYLEDMEFVQIISTLFRNCGEDDNIGIFYCVFVRVPETSVVSIVSNEITRSSDAVSLIGGTHFSGFVYRLDSSIELDQLTDYSVIRDSIRDNVIGTVPVGIRIFPITFSSNFLDLKQDNQKSYVRAISLNNPSITSTFYDVVLNNDDDTIIDDPIFLHRLYCSESCPISSFNTEYYLLLSILGFFLFFIVFICLPLSFYLCIRVVPRPNRNLGLREYKRNQRLAKVFGRKYVKNV